MSARKLAFTMMRGGCSVITGVIWTLLLITCLRQCAGAESDFLGGESDSEKSKANSAAYDTVLTIVVLELAFAFGVGLTCIVFSLNLVRSMQDAKDVLDYLPDGDLPPNTRSRLYKTQQSQKSQSEDYSGSNRLSSGLLAEGDFPGSPRGGGGGGECASSGTLATLASGSGGGLPSHHSFMSTGDIHDSEQGVVVGLLWTFSSYLKLW